MKFLQVGIIGFEGSGQTKISQLLLCAIVIQSIQVFCKGPVMLAVSCFWVVVVKNGCSLLDHGTHVKNELMKWADFFAW